MDNIVDPFIEKNYGPIETPILSDQHTQIGTPNLVDQHNLIGTTSLENQHNDADMSLSLPNTLNNPSWLFEWGYKYW